MAIVIARGRLSVRVPVTRAAVRWVRSGLRVAHSVRRAMIGSLLSTVVVAVAPGLIAGADPVGTLSAQVQAAETQVNADAARIHEFTVAYDQASTRAAALAQNVEGTTAQLTALHNQVGGTERIIRNEAVLAYTGQVSGSPKLATANPAQIGVSQMYLQSTVGNFSNTLDTLNVQQQKVAAGQTTLRDEERVQQHQLDQAAAARQQALGQAAAAQQLLNRAQAELVSTQQARTRPARPQAAAGPQGVPVGNSLEQTVASALSPPTAIAPAASTPTYVSTPTTSSPTTAGAPSAPKTVSAPTTTSATTRVSAPTTRSVPSTTARPITAARTQPTTAVSAPSSGSGGGSSGTLARLRQCESGAHYQENSGNGFSGAYQISQATWSSLGLPGRPDQAPSAVQDEAARTLVARGGWGQWPTCSALLGLGG